MTMIRRCVRELLPLAVLLGGTAVPAFGAAESAPEAEQTSRRPDWLLLGVAGIAFVIGRTVIQRRYKREGIAAPLKRTPADAPAGLSRESD